jgi:redox-sensitive bicupin YhaK (pirin superfamily)
MRIRVIAGEVDGVRGPVTEVLADPTYLDVTVPLGVTARFPIPAGQTAFAYLFEGAGQIGGQEVDEAPQLLVLGEGDMMEAAGSYTALRFLLVMGYPLHEPIARYGPFVMNTQEEIRQALQDLRNGTFVR